MADIYLGCVQQAYHKDTANQIANVDAIPLYMSCLTKAVNELQLRGLTVWTKLVQGNMANLSASDRCTVPSLLHRTSAAYCRLTLKSSLSDKYRACQSCRLLPLHKKHATPCL